MELDMPFRDAHHVTGAIVKLAEDKGVKLHELELKEMQKIEPRIDEPIYKVLKI